MVQRLRLRRAAPALVALATALLVTALERGRVLEAPETFFQDLAHTLSPPRATGHVVVVSIDDRALATEPNRPMVAWGPVFARGIARLRAAGARVIAIDYLFTNSLESWLTATGEGELGRDYDAPLREELSKGDVVLGGFLTPDGEVVLPLPDYLLSLPEGAADIGLVNVFTDPDGAVRRFVTAPVPQGPEPRLAFPALVAKRLGARFDEDAAARYIGFAGPPGTFPTVSFADAIADPPTPESQARLGMVKGRAVIIGAASSANPDLFATPYSRRLLSAGASWMTGAELHANSVETILSPSPPRGLPFPYAAVLFALAALAAAAACFWPSLPRAALLMTALFALPLLATVAAFRGGIFLPAAGLVASVVLSGVATLGLRLSREERQREKLRQMFGQHVSPEVVSALLARGQMPALGGEVRTITVLFSDIRSFTTHSERLAPQEVVEMLNAFFTQACEWILAEGGTVNEFIGDAILAIFGAPISYDDHARRALRAALALQEVAREFQSWMEQRFAGRDLPRFGIGVGIHTGPAVVGYIGSPRRMGYTAVGDTVNIASRLQGLTRTLDTGIVISEATRIAAGEPVALEKSQRVKVKGKDDEVLVHGLVGLEPVAGGEAPRARVGAGSDPGAPGSRDRSAAGALGGAHRE